jgi:hypothetical protein
LGLWSWTHDIPSYDVSEGVWRSKSIQIMSTHSCLAHGSCLMFAPNVRPQVCPAATSFPSQRVIALGTVSLIQPQSVSTLGHHSSPIHWLLGYPRTLERQQSFQATADGDCWPAVFLAVANGATAFASSPYSMSVLPDVISSLRRFSIVSPPHGSFGGRNSGRNSGRNLGRNSQG